MGKFYKNQALTIRLTSDMDISAADNLIKFRSPAKVENEVTPSLIGNYSVSYKTKLSEKGTWRVWINSTWGDDVVPSTYATIEVYEEGE